MTHSRLRHTRLLIGVLVLLFATGALSPGFSQTKKKRPGPVYYPINVNRVMRARLDQELDSERARVGDTFSATLVDPVYSKGGVLLIPQGSTVRGRVTNVQRAQKNGAPASMGVQFVSVVLPNGTHRAINGSLSDLSGKGGKSDNESQITANKTSHRTVKFVGGGAGGGALIGAIAGGGKGAAIGAGIGAATGLITGRVTKGHEVKVKSGTEFGVILNRAISLPKYKGGSG